MKLTPELIQQLSQATFCRPAIEALAEQFEDTPIAAINTLVAQLTEQGEDTALNRLLNVCAYTDRPVDPAVLAESAAVIKDITHLSYCYVNQSPDAIEPLVKMARAQTLSSQRQALLGRLAAELALRHQVHKNDVNRLLQHLLEEIQTPPTSILIADSIQMLKSNDSNTSSIPILSECNLHTDLPERPPRKIIGNGETIRRPIPKLGRNAPCHCGSGKKYKRCCLEKDQAILADASSYEGVTHSQLMENPGLVDDADIIRDLRAYELKKLSPQQLTTNQLIPAHQKACIYGLLDISFSMLDEYSRRSDLSSPFDPMHFYDLMELALEQGNLELAQRARTRIPNDNDLIHEEEIDFQFEIQTNPGHLKTLEARCKEAFCNFPDEPDGRRDHEFCELAHLLKNQFPALSILLARAAVQECPDRMLDNELLIENVHQARIDLGLPPWEDPIDTWFDDHELVLAEQAQQSKQAEETDALRKQLAASRQKIRETEKGLHEKEALLSELKHELENSTAKKSSRPEAPETPQPAPQTPSSDTTNRLRRQIETLKAEIGNQQDKRQQLRRELEQERKKAQQTASSQQPAKNETETDDIIPERPGESAQTLLIPEYHSHFRDACQRLPRTTAAGALNAVTAFAVYDPAVWRNTRSIHQLPDIYRVRIGRNHRLLLSWIPGQSLTALDLIPRQDLESWIRRHA